MKKCLISTKEEVDTSCCTFLCMAFTSSCYSWVPYSRSSVSLGSDARSQASCTTEYEGDLENMSAGFERMQSNGEPQPFHEPDDQPFETYRDPRLPTPAKVRWLKAFHKVKQFLRDRVS